MDGSCFYGSHFLFNFLMDKIINMDEKEVLKKNLTIYRNEIWSITNNILQLRDKLLQNEAYIRCLESIENEILDPASDPHEIIYGILNCSSRLHKLFVVASKRDGEGDMQYNFRLERGELLRKYFLGKNKGEREIFKVAVRNSIEHFDERVDTLMNSLIDELEPKIEKMLILYNMTITSKQLFDPWELLLPIKVFVVDSLEYYMIDQKMDKQVIDLGKIFREIEKIRQNIISYVDENYLEDEIDRNGPVGIYILPKSR